MYEVVADSLGVSVGTIDQLEGMIKVCTTLDQVLGIETLLPAPPMQVTIPAQVGGLVVGKMEKKPDLEAEKAKIKSDALEKPKPARKKFCEHYKTSVCTRKECKFLHEDCKFPQDKCRYGKACLRRHAIPAQPQ